MTPETPGREGTSPGGGIPLRTFLLAAVLAAPLCLALSGCQILVPADCEEEHDSILRNEDWKDPMIPEDSWF